MLQWFRLSKLEEIKGSTLPLPQSNMRWIGPTPTYRMVEKGKGCSSIPCDFPLTLHSRNWGQVPSKKKEWLQTLFLDTLQFIRSLYYYFKILICFGICGVWSLYILFDDKILHSLVLVSSTDKVSYGWIIIWDLIHIYTKNRLVS